MRFRALTPFTNRTQPSSPYDPYGSFRGDLDDLFQRFFDVDRSHGFRGLAGFNPSVDVSETAQDVILKADLPGVHEDDIHLELHGDMLTLRGERSEEKEEDGENRRFVERTYGSFERTMRLPFTPAENDVRTDFKTGVLTVRVRKPGESGNGPKRIPIGKGL